MTVATTIPAPTAPDTDETRAALRARALRGRELHEARGSEIVRTGPFTYLVPGSGRPYAVNYSRETCECRDYEHAGLGCCKHLFAVGIHSAARRSAPGGPWRTGGHEAAARSIAGRTYRGDLSRISPAAMAALSRDLEAEELGL